MASPEELQRLEQKAAERLLEDERLRSNLTDKQAKTLLDWGLAQLSAQIAALGPATIRAQETIDEVVKRLQNVMVGINHLVGDRAGLSHEEMVARLHELVAPAQLDAEVHHLAEEKNDLSDDELLERLTSLASQAWPAPLPGSKRQAEKPSLPPADNKKAREASPSSRKPAGLLAGLGMLLALLYALYTLATSLLKPQVTPTPSEPTTGAGWCQVYFTAPKYPDRKADHQGGLDEKLTAFINTAKESVDVAIYQLDLPNVTQALLDARKHGCTIRVVSDIDVLNDPKENATFKQLQAADITVVGGNPNAIMHDKFVVVDKTAIWTGSWNFTENDTYRYNNNGILISSTDLAKNYTVVFEKMWRDKQFGRQRKPGGTIPVLNIGGVRVENYFAPEDNVAEKIIACLQKAHKSIYFMAFSFTDDAIGEVVRAKAKAGLKVRGVFENTGSETKFSEYGRMKAQKMDVLQDGNPYLMHHKVFIVDETTVILGSFNFSQNADTENDENLLIIEDAVLARAFLEEFERVYATARNPPKK